EGAVIAGTEGPVVLPIECRDGTLGVRPEHIQLALERGVRAIVDAVEYLGGDSLVACHIAQQPIAVRVAGSVALARGDVTWLAWPGGAQHFFNAQGVREPSLQRMPQATSFA
ncbi:MAG TPA: TOBE domain-containing protein, partial [Casimicrobiaceae bacterium]|nr:TOBE domain-containing protein [Casimicrobiaceae bacterium]